LVYSKLPGSHGTLSHDRTQLSPGSGLLTFISGESTNIEQGLNGGADVTNLCVPSGQFCLLWVHFVYFGVIFVVLNHFDYFGFICVHLGLFCILWVIVSF